MGGGVGRGGEQISQKYIPLGRIPIEKGRGCSSYLLGVKK